MKTGFIILCGDNHAKNILQERLKSDWWTWNVSPLNQARHAAGQLGWEFDNTESSEEFIASLLELSNDKFDYEYSYIVRFMEKILKSTKAEENHKKGNLLIAHVGKELADRLQDEFPFHLIHVDMNVEDGEIFENGRYSLHLGDDEKIVCENLNKILNLVCS